MTNAKEVQASLLNSRNSDGGWPSYRGLSWTEPTALALLALQGTLISGEARSLAASWLVTRQSADGGWPPCSSVSTSTWVTSLALLALAQEPEHAQSCLRGVRWLSGQVYSELNAFQGFLQSTFGISPSKAPGSAPWFPGMPDGSYLPHSASSRCRAGRSAPRTLPFALPFFGPKAISYLDAVPMVAGTMADHRNAAKPLHPIQKPPDWPYLLWVTTDPRISAPP